MRANGRKRTMSAVAALSLVAALVLGGPPTARATSDGPARGGPNEGIKVHGDWTIEVRNPDGSLVSRHEFKNALVAEGADALNKVFGIQYVVSSWSIAFWDSSGVGDQSPCLRGTTPTACVIGDPRYGDGGYPGAIFPNLTVTTPATGPNAGKLVLSGTATASNPQPSRIGWVSTALSLCPVTSLANTNCGGAAIPPNFTRRQLGSPVDVRPGQIVQFSVAFSFSS